MSIKAEIKRLVCFCVDLIFLLIREKEHAARGSYVFDMTSCHMLGCLYRYAGDTDHLQGRLYDTHALHVHRLMSTHHTVSNESSGRLDV